MVGIVGTVVVGEVVVHNTLSLFFTSCSFLYCFIMVSISSGMQLSNPQFGQFALH